MTMTMTGFKIEKTKWKKMTTTNNSRARNNDMERKIYKQINDLEGKLQDILPNC